MEDYDDDYLHGDEHDDDDDPGAVTATKETVLDYLTDPRIGGVSRARAQALMLKHSEIVSNGIRMRSFANHVGNRILEAEGAGKLKVD